METILFKFVKMDTELLKILSDELRDAKNIAAESLRLAKKAQVSADDALNKATSAWELIVITKAQVQDEFRLIRRPFWKRLIESI